MIIRFLIYGAVGCLIEVFWTGLCSLKEKNFSLASNTSLWMFFIYGLAIFFEPLFIFFAPLNFILRGLIYAAFIYSVEFITGSLLKRKNICPWDYSHVRYQIKGIVRLDYLPLWVMLGLLFEQLYWFML
jgi:uncharacterized membrane protein